MVRYCVVPAGRHPARIDRWERCRCRGSTSCSGTPRSPPEQWTHYKDGIFKLLRSPGINSKGSIPPGLCSLACRYDNPNLAPKDCSKIPAPDSQYSRIKIEGTVQTSKGSVTFCYGSGSKDPYHGITELDPDPYPAFFYRCQQKVPYVFLPSFSAKKLPKEHLHQSSKTKCY